jgi:hypothetical protein
LRPRQIRMRASTRNHNHPGLLRSYRKIERGGQNPFCPWAAWPGRASFTASPTGDESLCPRVCIDSPLANAHQVRNNMRTNCPSTCASNAHQHAHQVPIKMRTICPQSASRTRTEMGALPPALPITDHRPPFTGHRSPKTDHRPPAINPRLPFHSRCSIETSSAE